MSSPWKSENSDSLGKLWVDLLKYYTLDFKMSESVVNIRFLETMVRKERLWGKRMAIEGN